MHTDVIAWYGQGALTGKRLQSAIDEAMDAIADDDEELQRLGLSRVELATTHFKVKEEGGFVAEGILLAIAIGAASNLTADGAKALWNKVSKKIKEKHGDDALGPKKQPRREG